MPTHPDNPRLPKTPIRVTLEQDLLLQNLLVVTTICADLANAHRKWDVANGRAVRKVGTIPELFLRANILAMGNAACGDWGLQDLLETDEGRSLVRGVISHADRRSYDGWHKRLTSKRYRTEYKKSGRKKRIKWFQKPHSKKRDSIQIPARFVTFSRDVCSVVGLGDLAICRTDVDWSPEDLRYITITRSGVDGWCLSAWQGSEWWGTQTADDYPHPDDYYKADIIGIDLGVKVMAACYDGGNAWTVPLPDCTEEDKTIALCRERLCTTSQGSKKCQKFQSRLDRALARKQRKLDAAQHKFVHDLLQMRPRYLVIEGMDIVELMSKNDGQFAAGFAKAQANGWRRLLLEKGLAAQNGIRIIYAEQMFPSTKLCPNPYCGHREPLTIEDRWYECPECRASQDRDEAAAVSLYLYGLLQVRQDRTEGFAPTYSRWKDTGKVA